MHLATCVRGRWIWPGNFWTSHRTPCGAGAGTGRGPTGRRCGGGQVYGNLRGTGRFHEPGTAAQRIEILAPHAGELTAVDNRRIARIAKLAGAPRQKSAGIRLLVRIGD
jgi:Thymidine phosphorylase